MQNADLDAGYDHERIKGLWEGHCLLQWGFVPKVISVQYVWEDYCDQTWGMVGFIDWLNDKWTDNHEWC